jgi:hypothetical protein
VTGTVFDADFLGLEDPTEVGAPPQPLVDWTTDDLHALEAAFDELDAWVEWLVNDYGLTPNIIPECWAAHGALLWELSALHHGWTQIYRLPEQGELGSGAAVQWQQQFSAARSRLVDWVARAGCRPGEHHA